MKRLNILHVVDSVAPRYGGAGIAARWMASYQARIGHRVTICTTNVDYPQGTLKVPSGIPVFKNNVWVRHFEVTFRPLLFSVPLWMWLKTGLSSFDVVHIHGLYRFPVASAAWWARRACVPYLIMPHGSLDPFLYKQSRYNVPLKRIYERVFVIPNLNQSAAIHYTAEDESKQATFLKIRSKPVIIPNGIDWDGYRCRPPKGNFRRRLKMDSLAPLVLFVGRINFKKGLDLLVPAFGRVARQCPEARLAVVGPDNEGYCSNVRQWCEEQGIQHKVFFVDHLGIDKLKEAYVDADVFVLPSYTENFGLTVVEAMASGTPVIISDKVNIWRDIQKAGAGIVVGLDPFAVSNAIRQVLSDKRKARAMGARGRAAAQQFYAWPQIVKRLIQVYRGLMPAN